MTETAEPRKFRNLAKRTATALVLIAVALAALYAGRWSFWLLAALLAVAMIVEWAWLMGVVRWKTAVAALAVAALMVFIHPSLRLIDETALMALAGAALAGSLLTISLRVGMGIFYVGLATVAIVFLREQEGLVLTLWTLAIVWGTDIAAYFTGKLIGGPKLAPKLSPNKTWAGLIGGIAAATAVSAAFVAETELPETLIPFAALLAIVAQSGDVYESWLKRRAGVKDSSNLFPGHGGALDRLDGLMPVAICVAGFSATGWL